MKKAIIAIVIALAIGGSYFYTCMTKPKTGYIVITEVYNNFDLKKELEKKYTISLNARKKIIDSLTFELQLVANKLEAEKNNKELEKLFVAKRDELLTKKQMLEEDNNNTVQQFDNEILTQLNQYVADFGKKNKYTYIFGTSGNGSLMYGDESKNITKEVIEFINDSYKGKITK